MKTLSEDSLENTSICSKVHSNDVATATTIKMSGSNNSCNKYSSDNNNNRKYNKITHELRLRFLDKIFFENKSIKRAAQELNINYSSAKTILNLHRKKQRFQHLNASNPSMLSRHLINATQSDPLLNKINSLEEHSPADQASAPQRMCAFVSSSAFKQQKLDLITTLGGRYTSTNKIEPVVAIPLQKNVSSVTNAILSKQLVPTSTNLIESSNTLLQQGQLVLAQFQQNMQQQQSNSVLPQEILSMLLAQQKQLEFQQQQQNLLISQLLQIPF